MAVIMSTDQGSAGYYPHVVLFRYTNNIENVVKYLQVNAHKKNTYNVLTFAVKSVY